MKKKLLLLCFQLYALNLFAQSPITLDRSDFPCPNTGTCPLDSVLFTNVPIASNQVDVTVLGANSIWNQSSLTTTNTAYQRFVPASTAPLAFQLIFFGSDYANPLLGNQSLAGLPVSDAYEFYNYSTNNSRLEIRGFGANLTLPGQTTAVPLPAVYSSPDVLYRFPINFGDKDSSTSGYSVTVPPVGTALATIKRNQKRVNEVDAWGSLTTPAGTFDVLRVKSTINRIDSIITGFFPIGLPTETIEYKWIAKGKKIPVLQVNQTNVAATSNTTSITYWGQGPTSIGTSEGNLSSNLVLSPNPASEVVTLQFEAKSTGKLSMHLYDMRGQKVAYFEFLVHSNGLFKQQLPLNELPSGNYLARFSLNGQHSAQKLSIQ